MLPGIKGIDIERLTHSMHAKILLVMAGICGRGAGDLSGFRQQLQKQWEADESCSHNHHRKAACSTAGSTRDSTFGQAAERWRSHEALLRYIKHRLRALTGQPGSLKVFL